MDNLVTLILYSLGILAISMAGAYLPRVKTLSDRQIHLLVALSTGIFLGLLFLLLLPEALEECEHGGIDAHDTMFALLGGFILIMQPATDWLSQPHSSPEERSPP